MPHVYVCCSIKHLHGLALMLTASGYLTIAWYTNVTFACWQFQAIPQFLGMPI